MSDGNRKCDSLTEALGPVEGLLEDWLVAKVGLDHHTEGTEHGKTSVLNLRKGPLLIDAIG